MTRNPGPVIGNCNLYMLWVLIDSNRDLFFKRCPAKFDAVFNQVDQHLNHGLPVIFKRGDLLLNNFQGEAFLPQLGLHDGLNFCDHLFKCSPGQIKRSLLFFQFGQIQNIVNQTGQTRTL